MLCCIKSKREMSFRYHYVISLLQVDNVFYKVIHLLKYQNTIRALWQTLTSLFWHKLSDLKFLSVLKQTYVHLRKTKSFLMLIRLSIYPDILFELLWRKFLKAFTLVKQHFLINVKQNWKFMWKDSHWNVHWVERGKNAFLCH